MSRELRVAALLTGRTFLATLAAFCGLLVILRGGWVPRAEVLAPLFVILLLQQLTFRVVRVGAADAWRLLPGGLTVFVRALALLVLGLALLVGGLWSWSNGQLAFDSVPCGRFVFCFVLLSMMSIFLLMTIQQRRGPWFTVAGVIVSVVLVMLVFQEFPSPVLWWTLTALFAAAWLVAAFGKLPAPASPGSAGTHASAAHGWLPGVSPATRTLLQLEGRGPGRLLIAAVVVVICALLQHTLQGHGALIDNFSGIMATWLASLFLFEMALTLTARARLLWLRTGNGRGGMFAEVERVLLVNLASLSLVAWLASTLLAAARGISVEPILAGLLLLSVAASALGPVYLALIAGTLQGWWSKAPIALVGVAAMTISPFLWMYAFGIRNPGLDAPAYGGIALLVSATLLLRFLAAWRWRHLDWSKIRITPREQWIRRASGS